MEESPQLFYKIENELTSTWLREWADEGVGEMEAYLAKHLAFLAFLDETEPQEAPHQSVERHLGNVSLSNLQQAA